MISSRKVLDCWIVAKHVSRVERVAIPSTLARKSGCTFLATAFQATHPSRVLSRITKSFDRLQSDAATESSG